MQTLLDGLNLSGASGACIVELGAGAGKFTELLVARPEGYLVIAVEPLAEMRERLAGKALTGVTAHNGHAANVAGVQDGWAAAVIAAQAFHWSVCLMGAPVSVGTK